MAPTLHKPLTILTSAALGALWQKICKELDTQIPHLSKNMPSPQVRISISIIHIHQHDLGCRVSILDVQNQDSFNIGKIYEDSPSPSVKIPNNWRESLLQVERQNIAGRCHQTFENKKFVDMTQQCFVLLPQVNFPANNLNFH